MNDVATLLRAIATLLWPILVFVALWVFREPLAQALSRLKKGKILGQEFELERDLQKLEETTAAARQETSLVPRLELKEDALQDDNQEPDTEIRSILEQAARSPKVALMFLSAELEKQGRLALAMRGMLQHRTTVPVSRALEELRQYGFPPSLLSSLQLFESVRNKIVHGGPVEDDDVLRAIDSGITILRIITALPTEKNIVYNPGAKIYSDKNCLNLIGDAKGVILETLSPGGAMKTFRIFPTRRKDYEKGKQVAWEWNMGSTWGPAWYRDPDTDEIKQAWLSSAEFVGRHLEDV